MTYGEARDALHRLQDEYAEAKADYEHYGIVGAVYGDGMMHWIASGDMETLLWTLDQGFVKMLTDNTDREEAVRLVEDLCERMRRTVTDPETWKEKAGRLQ